MPDETKNDAERLSLELEEALDQLPELQTVVDSLKAYYESIVLDGDTRPPAAEDKDQLNEILAKALQIREKVNQLKDDRNNLSL